MIHILIGTRAQLIKMIPLMHQLQQKGVDYNFIFMAQHHETIYEMLDDFGIKKPDYAICDTGTDIVSSKQMVIWSFKVLFQGIKNRKTIFKGDKKGIVLIHGDAPPLLLGAILAKMQGLSVASIEAGLRSFNLFKPFPEEITRVLTSRLGMIDIFFCQDIAAIRNIKKCKGKAINTHGNTIIDAIRLASEVNQSKNMSKEDLSENDYAIVTLHRFETISSKDGLSKIVDLVLQIAGNIHVKFILHPPTRAALKKTGLYEKLYKSGDIELLPRMNFLSFNSCIQNAQFIVTDGGSNQEESAYLGVPCLLFRTETERSEGLGENVVLSKFDVHIIDEFVCNFKRYHRPITTTKLSPTALILEEILCYAD